MASNRKTKPALFIGKDHVVDNQPTPIQRREELIASEQAKTRHQPQASTALKIKLDQLKTIEPLTKNQKKFFDAYDRGDYFIGCLGSAGSGKTMISIYKGLAEVLDRSNPFQNVIIVRSCVPTRQIGYLPGSLEEKAEVYELPYREACANLFGRKDAWDRLKEQGFARFLTTTAIRGISLDDAVIIVDEVQSATYHEISTIMTRVGNRSKIIMVGDWRQNDLITNKNDVSGFKDFLKVARSMNAFSEIEFTRDDIVRSSLVRDWIIASEEMGY